MPVLGFPGYGGSLLALVIVGNEYSGLPSDG